ncbi:putative quinone oxidoreductase [Lyophyllum shimeji]|uniref:Quinone oxidoreductase n=1 Tax=Lyophyllum shimeji TaxID=47721 RepID=A0A9P3UPD4_LYOSH|nr:putative quinone oxidoreductase [Lyophyllum shimeji]
MNTYGIRGRHKVPASNLQRSMGDHSLYDSCTLATERKEWSGTISMIMVLDALPRLPGADELHSSTIYDFKLARFAWSSCFSETQTDIMFTPPRPRSIIDFHQDSPSEVARHCKKRGSVSDTTWFVLHIDVSSLVFLLEPVLAQYLSPYRNRKTDSVYIKPRITKHIAMRAVLIKDERGPVENLYIGEVPLPTPGPGEVLVKIKAFGLNRMDIVQREGFYPPPPGSSSILGVEFSGHISSLGPSVSGWKVGDEVLGLVGGGAYAEYIAVRATHILRKPSYLSWAQAAAIPENFFTAFQALILCAELKKGANVLVHAGASGVGVAAIQMARFYGAETVTATASTQQKLDWLLSLPNGATHVANYKTQDFAAVVRKVTNNKGADVVIDFVGKSHWKGNMEALAVDGHMTMLALLSGSDVDADLKPILYKRLRIQGSTLRSRSPEYQADMIARFEREIFGHITGSEGTGPLKIYIHKVYPWNKIQDAHREMEANANSGKIVVEVV